MLPAFKWAWRSMRADFFRSVTSPSRVRPAADRAARAGHASGPVAGVQPSRPRAQRAA
jgi:hypothetical protein